MVCLTQPSHLDPSFMLDIADRFLRAASIRAPIILGVRV
jgi:hypothetical protein